MARSKSSQLSTRQTGLLILGLILATALIFSYVQSNTSSSQADTGNSSWQQEQAAFSKCWAEFKNSEYSKLMDILTDLIKQRDHWFSILYDPKATEAEKARARWELLILEDRIQEILEKIALVKDDAYQALRECLREAGFGPFELFSTTL